MGMTVQNCSPRVIGSSTPLLVQIRALSTTEFATTRCLCMAHKERVAFWDKVYKAAQAAGGREIVASSWSIGRT